MPHHLAYGINDKCSFSLFDRLNWNKDQNKKGGKEVSLMKWITGTEYTPHPPEQASRMNEEKSESHKHLFVDSLIWM